MLEKSIEFEKHATYKVNQERELEGTNRQEIREIELRTSGQKKTHGKGRKQEIKEISMMIARVDILYSSFDLNLVENAQNFMCSLKKRPVGKNNQERF